MPSPPPSLGDTWHGLLIDCPSGGPPRRYLPIRAKFTKKHGRVVAKFDHYCYLLGNSIGEMNHGRFWRLLFAQNISIWTGYWLLTHGYISLHSNISWTIANAPLLALNLLTWIFGVPLIILLLIHVRQPASNLRPLGRQPADLTLVPSLLHPACLACWLTQSWPGSNPRSADVQLPHLLDDV